MAPRHTLFIDGIAVWSPSLPGWDTSRALLRGEAEPAAAEAQPRRPAPALLAANERRRAPDAVLLALEVASAALAASGHAAAEVATVFASAHGDLAITDAMCRTLASDPALLSPTRFHHSVHNAASGYWAIGSGSPAASTALAALDHSVALGLLEAAAQCTADRQPVMWVAGDTEATGPLASVNASRGLLAAALVLSPERSATSRWALDWALLPGAVPRPPLRSAAAQALAANASAPLLPLLEALAVAEPVTLAWPLSDALHLQLALRPLAGTPPSAGTNPTAA